MTHAAVQRSGSRLATAVLILFVANPPAVAGADELAAEAARVLANRCLECHRGDGAEGNLDLSRRESAVRGGDSGIAIVPGAPKSSLLWTKVREDNMPPEGSEGLSEAEKNILRRWIAAGARYDRNVIDPFQYSTSSRAGYDWWSLQPLEDFAHADLLGGAAGHPIDAFIRRKLSEAGLEMSSRAHPVRLMRRVTLDLTGLPPTPDEVDAFVRDAGDESYARLVDRLLESPRYGERWAQHWLDVIRWAETVGFETNLPRANAWPYRDWVIKSFNEDKPYDRFVFEQIAGDTVGDDAALGFLVAGPANLPGQIGRDEEAMRQARQDELDEVIRTVSQGLFGLTIGCARCHDHKFDPISQRDYYSMQAIFAGLSYGDRRLRGPKNDAWSRQVPDLRVKLEALRAELESLRIRHGMRPPLNDIQTEIFPAVVAKSIRMRIDATESGAAASLYEFEVWTPPSSGDGSQNIALASRGAQPSASSFALANQTRHFDNLVDGSVDERQAFPWTAAQGGPAWIRIDFATPARIDRIVWHRGASVPVDYRIEVLSTGAVTWRTVAHTRERLPRAGDVRKADQVQLDGLSSEDKRQLLDKIALVRGTQRELTRLLAGPQVYAASFTDAPGRTWLLRRGDPTQRGEEVDPAIPAVLGTMKLTSDSEIGRRLALARHLSSPAHPLTARVIVNRVWQHHFGSGLVRTPSDFGRMGAPPSHRDLLDWLSHDFVANGWSLKHLHRRIVTSEAYRQSSRPRDQALKVDADSRLLWRYPPHRLEAEAIRDSILMVSGKLNLEMGGPGFDFFQQRGGLSDYEPKETFAAEGWRRMVYAHKIRMQSVDIFGAFDCPDAGQMKPRRTRSITPLQSLSLLNSPFANRQAVFFAERVRNEAGEASARQIDRAFKLALARLPDTAERERMLQLSRDHGLEHVCRVLLNTSEFVYIQ